SLPSRASTDGPAWRIGKYRPHRHLWLGRDCQIDQGQVPSRRLPFPLSVHHRQDGHHRPDRRPLYCPSEDEVLHS
ncbi:hypothetical protein A2U01_0098667, partial [Trifolium medium]|nr:hypothetical protein [Trifolium medium]